MRRVVCHDDSTRRSRWNVRTWH